MLSAAARARRGSGWARSRSRWFSVYGWTVLTSARRTPKRSCNTFATSARQLVVHEALLITAWRAGSKERSLTPMQRVASTPSAFADTTTRRTLPPSEMCAAAAPRRAKRPVASTTTSTPASDQGTSRGSGAARDRHPAAVEHQRAGLGRHRAAEWPVDRVAGDETGEHRRRHHVVDRGELEVGTLAGDAQQGAADAAEAVDAEADGHVVGSDRGLPGSGFWALRGALPGQGVYQPVPPRRSART